MKKKLGSEPIPKAVMDKIADENFKKRFGR